MKGVPHIRVKGTAVEIESVVPDMSSIKQMRSDEFSIEIKLGEVWEFFEWMTSTN